MTENSPIFSGTWIIIWSVVGDTAWEGLGHGFFLEEACSRALRFQKKNPLYSDCSLCFLLVAQAVPATVSGDRYFVCSPQWWQSLHSGTLSQKQTSTFTACLGHGILYNNRKVAKTLQIPFFLTTKEQFSLNFLSFTTEDKLWRYILMELRKYFPFILNFKYNKNEILNKMSQSFPLNLLY